MKLINKSILFIKFIGNQLKLAGSISVICGERKVPRAMLVPPPLIFRPSVISPSIGPVVVSRRRSQSRRERRRRRRRCGRRKLRRRVGRRGEEKGRRR